MKNNAIPDVTAMAGIQPPPKLGILRMLDASPKTKQVQGYQSGGEVDDFKYGEPSANGEIEPGSIVGPTYNSDGRLESGDPAVFKAALRSAKQSAPVSINEYKPRGILAGGNPSAQTLGDSRATTPSGTQSAEPDLQISSGSNGAEPGDRVVSTYDASQDANVPKFDSGFILPSSAKVPKASNYHQTGTVGDVSYNGVSSRIASSNPYSSDFGNIRSDRGDTYTLGGYQEGGEATAENPHPIGPKDTVPAMLEEGEFVLTKGAVDTIKQKKGIHALKRLNHGDIQGFQNGEEVFKLDAPRKALTVTPPKEGELLPRSTEINIRSPQRTLNADPIEGSKTVEGKSVAHKQATVSNIGSQGKGVFELPKPKEQGYSYDSFKENAARTAEKNRPFSTESHFEVPDEGKDTYHRTQAEGPNKPSTSATDPLKARESIYGRKVVEAAYDAPKGIFGKSVRTGGKALGAAAKVAGKVFAPITAINEGMEAYEDNRVLKNPEDKVNRMDEGISRAAGAIAGGTLGAAAGPVGSVLGGAAGYLLPDAVNAVENTATKYYNKFTGKPEVAPNVLASDKADRIRQNRPTEDPVPVQATRKLATDDMPVVKEDQIEKQNSLAEASNQKDIQNIRATGEAFKKDLANREVLQRNNGPVRSDYAGTPEGEREFTKRSAENMERQQNAITEQRQAEYAKTPEGKEAALKQQVREGILKGYKRALHILEAPYSYGDSTLAAAKEQKEAGEKLLANDAAIDAQAKKESYDNRYKDEDQAAQREEHRSRMDYYAAQKNDPKKILEQQVAEHALGAANGVQEDVDWLENYNTQSKGKQNSVVGIDYARKVGLPNAESISLLSQVPSSWLTEFTEGLGEMKKKGASEEDRKAYRAIFSRKTGLNDAEIDAAVTGKYNDLALNQQNDSE